VAWKRSSVRSRPGPPNLWLAETQPKSRSLSFRNHDRRDAVPWYHDGESASQIVDRRFRDPLARLEGLLSPFVARSLRGVAVAVRRYGHGDVLNAVLIHEQQSQPAVSPLHRVHAQGVHRRTGSDKHVPRLRHL